jgi:flagellar protein FlaJ
MGKNMKKRQKNKKNDQWVESVKEKYKLFCLKIIGRRFSERQKFANLGEKLKMADIKLTPEIYISITVMTGVIVTLASLFAYYIIFQHIIGSASWISYTLILTGITSAVSFGYFPFVVKSKISNRKSQIDHDMPFVLSKLSILSSTGLTPIKIFRNMVQREEQTAITSEFKKIVYKIDVEGKDIITSVSETAKETPSEVFREALWDIANMIHQGGSLDRYLREKADTTMQLKRDIQKEFIDKLGTFSEIYISLVLVGVIFLGIAAVLLDIMRSDAMGLTASSLLLLLAYGLIPIAVIAINILVSMSYSRSV